MSKDKPTPEELDKLSDAVLGTVRCSKCGQKFPKFTQLVAHIKTAHP